MEEMRAWEEEDAFKKILQAENYRLHHKLMNIKYISFEEFLKLVYAGVEMEFKYKKKHLGIIPYDKLAIFEWNKDKDFGVYKDIVEFKHFAKIGKKSLKSCFNEFESFQAFY